MSLRTASIVGSGPNVLAAAVTLAQCGVAAVTERSVAREALGDAPALRLGKKAVRVRWAD